MKKRRLITAFAAVAAAAIAVIVMLPHGSSGPGQAPQSLPSSLKSVFANSSQYTHSSQYPKGNSSGIGAIKIVSVEGAASDCPVAEVVVNGELIFGKAGSHTVVTPPPSQNPYFFVSPANTSLANIVSSAEKTGRKLYIEFTATGGGVSNQQSQFCRTTTYNTTRGTITAASFNP
jgi:hypothetical protein